MFVVILTLTLVLFIVKKALSPLRCQGGARRPRAGRRKRRGPDMQGLCVSSGGLRGFRLRMCRVEGVEGFRASRAYIGSKGFKGVWDLEGSRFLFMRLQ